MTILQPAPPSTGCDPDRPAHPIILPPPKPEPEED